MTLEHSYGTGTVNEHFIQNGSSGSQLPNYVFIILTRFAIPIKYFDLVSKWHAAVLIGKR
jgi:hypothetical protein